MKLLRIVVALAVLAYAGWLAWPLISPFLEGAGADAAAMRAGAEAQGLGELFGAVPTWAIWGAAVVFYLVAALMLGAGDPRAAVAYFLGFLADAALRLALDRQGGAGEAAARSAPTTMAAPDAWGLPVDPLWLVLGGLFVLGLLVAVASRRIRRARTPGRLAY